MLSEKHGIAHEQFFVISMRLVVCFERLHSISLIMAAKQVSASDKKLWALLRLSGHLPAKVRAARSRSPRIVALSRYPWIEATRLIGFQGAIVRGSIGFAWRR